MRFSKINSGIHSNFMKRDFISKRTEYNEVFKECLATALNDYICNIDKYKEESLKNGISTNYPIINFYYGVTPIMLEGAINELYGIRIEDVVHSNEEENDHYKLSFGYKCERIYGFGNKSLGTLTLYCNFAE